MNVGLKVKELREKKGLSKTDVAKAVGISTTMMCWIERGSKNPSLQTGKLIAEVLGCSVDDLLD